MFMEWALERRRAGEERSHEGKQTLHLTSQADKTGRQMTPVFVQA